VNAVLSPDGAHLLVVNSGAGIQSLQVVASRTGQVVQTLHWGDGTLSVVDVASRSVAATVKVGSHPNTMVWDHDGGLIVADANSDAVSVVDTGALREARRISVSPYSGAPLSSSPEGLAVSPDGDRLYVADSGADEVTVVDLEARGHGPDVLGRIPTAWYPTSVTTSKDGSELFVTNAKGNGAGPNARGFVPNPTTTSVPFQDGVGGYADGYCNCTFDNYTGSMMVGTLSSVPVPSPQRLALYTDQVARNNHYGDRTVDERSPGNPVPARVGEPSPIKHVIYVIKENRTYDQVFGDLKQGNGDPALTLFGAANTPNLHALAQRFGILDNLYADAEVSADGHNWSTAANATDYNDKMWPQDYSPAAGRNRGYDFEGASSINLSPGGYLWDAAAQARLSLRDYGEFAINGPLSTATLIPESQASACPGPIARSYTGVTVPAGQVLCFQPTTVNTTTTPALAGKEDPNFRGYDLRYREADRVQEWAREFAQFEQHGALPSLEIMRLPNDHTAGTAPGTLTPQEYVAENDRAVGQVVDTVSHSRDWATTAIFVIEDDAQNGPDHVDAHRTEALVISPYTQRPGPFVDHTLYDTSAMLRTMELILGATPLSQYDANATPMWRLFHTSLDPRPFGALPEGIGASQVNTADSYGAAQSGTWNFDAEDRAPMDQLNDVVWHAVKGPNVPYPGQSGPQPDPNG
jgi:YVTN family beta-propeller protein